MNKREAHELARALGVEALETATGKQVVELIQQAVDDAAEYLLATPPTDEAEYLHQAGLARLIEAADAAGISPSPAPEPDPEAVEGEVVEDDAPTEEHAAEVPELTVGEVADEVGKALALREQAVTPTHALPTPAEYNVLGLLANRTYQTTFVPSAYRGREADVFAAFLFGREIGLGPMMALRDIHMIDGRPALAAHRQLAKLREGGVSVLESESTAERAWVRARRADTGEVMTVEFTMVEAEKVVDKKGARLVDKVNWRSYPADMLWARCVGRLTRRLGPDLAGGLPPYVAEEVADFSGWGVEYGEGGEVTLRNAPPEREIPEYRKEFPDYNWPNSWAELRERFSASIGADEYVEWARQAAEHMHPGLESVANLNPHDKTQLFKTFSGALATVDQRQGDFPPPSRTEVTAAFARVMDGAALEGPPWRLGPDETDRPTREEWLEQRAAEAPAAEAEAPAEKAEPPAVDPADLAPDGGDIPFDVGDESESAEDEFPLDPDRDDPYSQ